MYGKYCMQILIKGQLEWLHSYETKQSSKQRIIRGAEKTTQGDIAILKVQAGNNTAFNDQSKANKTESTKRQVYNQSWTIQQTSQQLIKQADRK